MSKFNKQQEDKIEQIVTNIIISKFDDNWMSTLIDKITEKVEQSCKNKLKEQEEKINQMEKEVNNLKIELEQVKMDKDNVEQYTRKNNVRIFGIKEVNQENTENLVIKLCQEKLNINLTANDIEICHRVGTNNNKNNRPIFVKLISNKVKNDIYYAKSKLKGLKITIREDITKHRMEIIKTAVEEFGPKNVWTQNGSMYIYCNNKKNYVKNVEELLSLIK